jgi:LacI family transcriptional regulator
VLKAARQLDYRPHAVVSSLMAQLRTLREKPVAETIGFITAWPTRDGWQKSPNHRRFFAGVKRRAGELGYKVEVFWLREPGMTSRRMSQILRVRGIRGLILPPLPKAHGHLSLEWRHFAAVAKGLTIARPRLHRVISSHFEDMRLVGHHLKRLGYRRLGLVLDAELDARVDRAWRAAYLLHQHDLPSRDRVPPLVMSIGESARKFGSWFAKHRPEVIVFSGLPVCEWGKEIGLRVPEDAGLVHLDWSEEVGSLAGIDADAEALGAAAMDLLVGQLHAHEYGIPWREKIVAVSGRWVMGPSIRRVHFTVK